MLVGILPLYSHRNAEFLHNEVPGMSIPEDIRERMRKAGSGEEAQAEGVRIAQEALLAARETGPGRLRHAAVQQGRPGGARDRRPALTRWPPEVRA